MLRKVIGLAFMGALTSSHVIALTQHELELTRPEFTAKYAADAKYYLGTYIDGYNTQIKTYQDNIAALTAQRDQQVKKLNNDIAAINKQIDAANKTLQTNVAGVTKQITDVQTNVNTIKKISDTLIPAPTETPANINAKLVSLLQPSLWQKLDPELNASLSGDFAAKVKKNFTDNVLMAALKEKLKAEGATKIHIKSLSNNKYLARIWQAGGGPWGAGRMAVQAFKNTAEAECGFITSFSPAKLGDPDNVMSLKPAVKTPPSHANLFMSVLASADGSIPKGEIRFVDANDKWELWGLSLDFCALKSKKTDRFLSVDANNKLTAITAKETDPTTWFAIETFK